MAQLNDLINNGKLTVLGKTECSSCKICKTTGVANLAPLSGAIKDNTSSENLVTASQVAAYITYLKSL